MKRLCIFMSLSFLSGIALTSCGSVAENNATSVHVDSSNINGAAPVRYGPDNPADTTAQPQTSDDTGRRANTEPK